MSKFTLSCFMGGSWLEESEPFSFNVWVEALGKASLRSKKEHSVIKVDHFIDEEEGITKDWALVDSGEVFYNLENTNLIFLLSEIQCVLWDRYKEAYDKNPGSNECEEVFEIHNVFYRAYKSIRELKKNG